MFYTDRKTKILNIPKLERFRKERIGCAQDMEPLQNKALDCFVSFWVTFFKKRGDLFVWLFFLFCDIIIYYYQTILKQLNKDIYLFHLTFLSIPHSNWIMQNIESTKRHNLCIFNPFPPSDKLTCWNAKSPAPILCIYVLIYARFTIQLFQLIIYLCVMN